MYIQAKKVYFTTEYSNKFVTGVENEATGDSNLNNSPDTVTAVKIFGRYCNNP